MLSTNMFFYIGFEMLEPKGVFPAMQKVFVTSMGYLLILYCLSFLLFAIIRVLTGVSIKRLGYFSLRHVSFSPKPGIQISIGKVGLSLHRPNVARPGWLSVHMSNFDLTFDPKIVLDPESQPASAHKRQHYGDEPEESNSMEREWSLVPPKTTLFYLMRFILRYTKCFDFSAASSSITYTGIGCLIVGNFQFRIDLRNMMNRMKKNFVGTLDTHKLKQGEIPAYCRLMMYDFYLAESIDDDNPRELLDAIGLDVFGVLGIDDLSVKDLSLTFKSGKSLIHTDKVAQIINSLKQVRQDIAEQRAKEDSTNPKAPLTEKVKIFSESDIRNLVRIGTHLVRVVKEVEFKASYIGVFNVGTSSVEENDKKYFAGTAKDLSLDLRRLNPQSPGFKLFFNEGDSAHQAIFTMSSVSIGIDSEESGSQELVYIPMTTMITRTNIFSKTIQFVKENDAPTNQSILLSNVNMTSPTVDIEAHHIPILLQALSGETSSKSSKLSLNSFRKLWPRASIKLTIDQPAARMLFSPNKDLKPFPEKSRSMVISSSSKINCDFESSHSTDPNDPAYNSNASLQVTSFDTWYRSPSGTRYDVLLSENLFVKISTVLNPSPSLSISAIISNAHVLLTKPELFRGIREFMLHVKKGKDRKPSRSKSVTKTDQPKSFLRQLPLWLSRMKLEIADTAVSIASEQQLEGEDYHRGLTLKMENSVVDYRKNWVHKTHRGETQVQGREMADGPDGQSRQLMITMKGIEGHQVVEPFGLEQKADNQFIRIPAVNVSFVADMLDNSAPVQCNVIMKHALVKYSLTLHLLTRTAVDLLIHNLVLDEGKPKTTAASSQMDVMNVHVRTDNIRVKAAMPGEIKVMLETNCFEVQLRQGFKPRCRATAIRLYSSHPYIPEAWCRLISLKGAHAEMKHKNDKENVLVNFDGMRLNVPSQFIFHKVLDNLVTMFKAIILLQTRYKGGKKLKEEQESEGKKGPKEKSTIPNLPRIRIKSPALLMTIEDDHFESRLGLIFQVGLREQKIRLEKERAFESKAEAIRKAEEEKEKRDREQHYETPSPASSSRIKKSTSSLRLNKGSQKSPGKASSGLGNSVANSSSESINSVPSRAESEEQMHSEHSGLQSHVSSFFEPMNPLRGVSGGKGHHQHKKSKPLLTKPIQTAFHHSSRKKSGIRYKMTQTKPPDEKSSVGIEEARQKLNENISKSWIRKFNEALESQRDAVQRNIHNIWGSDEIDEETAANERIVEYSDDPILFCSIFKNLDLLLRTPSFNNTQLREFLHNIGKGLPMDTRFSLLVPLYAELSMSEWRTQLRDYPLPLIHFPELHSSQDPSLRSVKIKGELVVAEELWPDEASIRRIRLPLVPKAADFPNNPQLQNYILEVIRTISAVKIYTDLNVDVNTKNPTRITWANSMQPAIQTVMLAFDSFSKPPIDPSSKVGFWDKIRFIFHARIDINWREGDVFLMLKGSRSPYDLLSDGAGFVMGWRNNVKLSVNSTDNPKELLIADSEEYILAVPNYIAQEADYMRKAYVFSHAMLSRSSFNEYTKFRKVLMKLSGKVRWVAGLLFEMDREGSLERTSEFRPHYEVQLRKPEYISDVEHYDTYKGFRSQYMHMATSVTSKYNDDDADDGQSYNTVHLTPRALYHFRSWWGLFDGSLSLPIRSGRLFQERPERKPKFGRHLFTVKYQLSISPLFIAHSYMHPHSEDLTKNNKQEATGLKAKVENFTMDLHQRREQEYGKRWRMKVHQGELDFQETDLRVIMAQFKERSTQELVARKLGVESSPSSLLETEQSSSSATNSAHLSGKFKVSDNDFSWVDMNDYAEIDATPVKSIPKITVLPWLYTPRWTYIRQTDHSNTEIGVKDDGEEFIKFGNEQAHDCLIGKSHPEETQVNLMRRRVTEIDEQLKTDDATLDSLLSDLKQYPDEPHITERVKRLRKEIRNLTSRRKAIVTVIERNSNYGSDAQSTEGLAARGSVGTGERLSPMETAGTTGASSSARSLISNLDETAYHEEDNAFSNRYIIHNVQFKWNNSVRNAVYRYMHKVGDRRAFSYFITRKAVKYIEDLIEKQQSRNSEQQGNDEQETEEAPEDTTAAGNESGCTKDEVERLIGQMFKAGTFQHNPEGEEAAKSNDDNTPIQPEENAPIGSGEHRLNNFETDLREVREGHEANNTYLVRFTSPQIQLVSDQNPDQCVLVTSQNIELKIINVMDNDEEQDEVSGLVETRYGVLLQEAQFFVLSQSDIKEGSVVLFSTNSYGCGKSISWPPWLALECCYDSKPLSEALVVDKTSVALRYDKPNTLRVQKLLSKQSTRQSHDEKFCANLVRAEKYRANRISVDFPKVVATCDSTQYFAIYTIVVDLLVYSEPIRRKRSEALEEVLLATDFSDLNKAVGRLNQLQEDIRHLQELRTEFAVRMGELDEQGRADSTTIEVEYQHSLLELMVMMRALREGMQRGNYQREDVAELLKWAIASDQIIWHVLSKDRKPFLDIGLADASFNRIEGRDGFNSNTVEVGMMQGFNLTPHTLYPELFSPYIENDNDDLKQGNSKQKLIYVEWTMLDPIGGIPVMERFGVSLLPLKLQLERDTGKRIFEYIFPSSADGDESPFVVSHFHKKSGSTELVEESDRDSAVDEGGESEMQDDGDSSSTDDDEYTSVYDNDQGSISSSKLAKVSLLAGGHRRLLGASQKPVFGTGSGSSLSAAGKSKSRGRSPTTDSSSVLSHQRSSSRIRSVSGHSDASSNNLGRRGKGKEKHTDDLSLMMQRSSNYMSIVDIKIESTVLCISYKGHGSRNLTDIHEFVIRLPELEYKNKMWSNLDLALRLKKGKEGL
ncbi:hypothetical protein TRICI_001086 [Trichomonascus ciferrii]|uniref:Uncharacterized protein n=1 Tax=Trichomonascus ciferrii TaxID=44093 RepID=A0A642VAB6_9ASCO|nr:hypothetical protein TRICI_001086 [Trichomonascus ciferrii]